MEKKLFYQDAYLKIFNADLLREERDESGRPFAILSQTAFYPTGGGQPFDTGTLNGVEVLEVEEIDGEIRHYLAGTLGGKESVEGKIDWNRRFDHMQQHAGQHLLSAVFEEMFQYKTVSFHLGRETLTIDLDTDHLTNQEVNMAEERANEIILENRPIIAKWVREQELIEYKLRKELTVSENIRLVIIPDLDYNGCGGTHPNSTGQVASLKVIGWERQKKKVRIEFVCGNRVLKLFDKKNTVLKQLAILLNAPEQDMNDAVQRMQEHRRNLEKTVEDAQERLLSYEVSEMIGNGNEELVRRVFLDRSFQDLQKLGRLLAAEANDKVFLLVAENDEKLQFVFAKGELAKGNMNHLAKDATRLVKGKGGGSERLAQGGGEKLFDGNEFLDQVVNIYKNMSENRVV